ncbi:MAG: hypothetical protein IKD74_00665 [Clostridia bacterium]|nr:hypothetical protein [Clostridia bacterium]
MDDEKQNVNENAEGEINSAAEETVEQQEQKLNDIRNELDNGVKTERIDVQYDESKAIGTVKSTIAKYKKQAEKKYSDPKLKFKYFKKEKGIDKNSIDDLSEEEKADFDKFELSDEAKEEVASEIYENAKDEIIHINTARHAKIKEMGTRIDDLRAKAQKLLDDKIDKLNGMDPSDKNYSEVENEINRLKAVLGKIGQRGSIVEGTLTKDLSGIMSTQDKVRENAYTQLKDVFGEKLISKDRAVLIPERDTSENRTKENETNVDRSVDEGNEEKDLDEENKQEQAQNTVSGPAQQVAGAAAAQKVAGAAQQAASQGARADGAQQNPGAVTVDDVKKGNIPKEYLSAMFGIENLSSLDGNYEKSWEVLQMFSSSAIPDSTRLELLNDNKSRLIIMKAFEEVDTFHPRKGAQYIDTRMKLLNLRTPMMETALKSMGIEITDTKNIASDFAKMSKELDKMEKTIKEDKSMDPEMKEAKLEELNKYRDSYKNVNKFIAATNKVKSPRTYLRQAKQWLSQNIRIFEKDNLQKLAAADEEVKPKDNRADEPTVDNTEVREQEVKTTDRAEFVKNYGTNTEMTELKAKQILDEDKTQETKNINSQEIDESQIGK